ncbi:hypothetical protein I317_04240 [Kwoniella heveanensis CBS 569]|nr:hypothetical protein I317_04240 [Kwoniella heveanensis CBS 569]
MRRIDLTSSDSDTPLGTEQPPPHTATVAYLEQPHIALSPPSSNAAFTIEVTELKSLFHDIFRNVSDLQQRIGNLEGDFTREREMNTSLRQEVAFLTASLASSQALSQQKPSRRSGPSTPTIRSVRRDADVSSVRGLFGDMTPPIEDDVSTPPEPHANQPAVHCYTQNATEIGTETEDDYLAKRLLGIENASQHTLRSIRQAKSELEKSTVKHLNALHSARGEGLKALKTATQAGLASLQHREKELNTYVDRTMGKIKSVETNVAHFKASETGGSDHRLDNGSSTGVETTSAYSDPALKKLLNDSLRTKADERREAILARTLGPHLATSSFRSLGHRRPATFVDTNNIDGMDLETYLAAYNGEYEDDYDYEYSVSKGWYDVKESVGKGVPNRRRNEKLLVSCGGARSMGELLHLLRGMIRDQVEDLMGEWLVDIVRMEMDKIKQQQQISTAGKKNKQRK